MKYAQTFGDPQTAAKLHVDAWILDSPIGGPVTSGTKLPGEGSQPGVVRPLVVTRFDGWVNERIARIRVVVWANEGDVAWDLASYLHARALAHIGDDETSGYLWDGGPDRDIDPDFRTPISAYTLRLKMKPAMIAETREPRTTSTDA
jgi:hypothetical protein